jgi:hypothetical protein
MNEYLNALKEDLRDRRLLPLVVVAGALLLGALAYAVLGGGSSSSTPAALGPHRPPGLETGTLAVTAATASSSNALAETTSGIGAQQHQGASRNPFALLPGTVVVAATSSPSGGGSSSSHGSSHETASAASSGSKGASGSSSEPHEHSSGSGSGGSSGGHPKSSKPKTVYQVSVLFGEASSTSPSEGNQLQPYENLKLLTPLPSSKEPLLVFRGVSGGGTRATFTVAGETILHGNGKCLPSAFQCEALQLKAGQSEQVQYLPPGSQTVQSYELRLVSITPSEASAAKVASLWGGQSKAGMEVLRRSNLLAIPGLSMSSLAGVLVQSS